MVFNFNGTNMVQTDKQTAVGISTRTKIIAGIIAAVALAAVVYAAVMSGGSTNTRYYNDNEGDINGDINGDDNGNVNDFPTNGGNSPFILKYTPEPVTTPGGADN